MENPQTEQQAEELKYCHEDKCKLKVLNLALNFRTASDRELDDIVAYCWADCKARDIRNNLEKYERFLADIYIKFHTMKGLDRSVNKYIGKYDARQSRDAEQNSEIYSNLKLDGCSRRPDKYSNGLARQLTRSKSCC